MQSGTAYLYVDAGDDLASLAFFLSKIVFVFLLLISFFHFNVCSWFIPNISRDIYIARLFLLINYISE